MLLVNFPSLGYMNAGDNFQWLFREARINDAVLFFDECEALFESRDKGNSKSVNMMLTEMERHEVRARMTSLLFEYNTAITIGPYIPGNKSSV